MKTVPEKTRLPVSTLEELRVYFDKRQSGFSLTISTPQSLGWSVGGPLAKFTPFFCAY